jgi:hypothetical protein
VGDAASGIRPGRRDRAEAMRAKARKYYYLGQIRRTLRAAEEYDKIADCAEEWQRREDGDAD